MLINYLLILLASFFVGIGFIFLSRKLALRYKILVSQGVPLVGGIVIGLSFIFACFIGSMFYRNLWLGSKGIIIPSFIMFAFGLIDDWREMSILAKFLVQIVATTLLIFFGVRTQIVGIGSLANIILTFIWVLGISNAFNHLDIIDGLASGTAIIVSLAFFTISLINGDIKIAIFALALSGAIFSFMVYNLPPAKVYMGNSGSHFLGFILAAIALAISYAPLERKMALFSPILILGFPIFDTAFLILMRIKQGRSAFKKSNDHLALRFLKLGYSKKKTLMFMLILALFFSSCGVAISRASNFFGLIIIIFSGLASLAVAGRMSKVSIDA